MERKPKPSEKHCGNSPGGTRRPSELRVKENSSSGGQRTRGSDLLAVPKRLSGDSLWQPFPYLSRELSLGASVIPAVCSSTAIWSRSTCFLILVPDIGQSSTNRKYLGTLKVAISPRQ